MLDRLEKHISEIESCIDSLISRMGFTYSQFAVLYCLGASEGGHCTQKIICDKWVLPKQTVYNICKEYKKKGWIVFSESSSDKREKYITLTESGRPYAEKVFSCAEAFSEKVLKNFGKVRTERLYALLSELDKICREELNSALPLGMENGEALNNSES